MRPIRSQFRALLHQSLACIYFLNHCMCWKKVERVTLEVFSVPSISIKLQKTLPKFYCLRTTAWESHLQRIMIWRAGTAQRWEHSLKFDFNQEPHLVWVCCWFSPCSENFYPVSPIFLPLQKSTSPISNLTRIEDPHDNNLLLAWLPIQIL